MGMRAREQENRGAMTDAIPEQATVIVDRALATGRAQGFEPLTVAVLDGVLIRTGEARVVGPVGISGDTSDRAEYRAILGIRATGG